jgi:hypothetical protein
MSLNPHLKEANPMTNKDKIQTAIAIFNNRLPEVRGKFCPMVSEIEQQRHSHLF